MDLSNPMVPNPGQLCPLEDIWLFSILRHISYSHLKKGAPGIQQAETKDATEHCKMYWVVSHNE